MTAPNSGALVQAAQQGDMTAYAQLWCDYRPAVFSFALAQTRNYHNAEDVISETFTRALNRIDTMARPISDVGAWFRTIALNIIRDDAVSSRTQLETLVGDFIDIPLDDDPADRIIRNDTATRVRCLVRDTLAGDQLTCIQQRFFESRTVPETAALIGRDRVACNQVQLRAIRKLHARVNPGGHRSRRICEHTPCTKPSIGLYCSATCQRAGRVLLGNPNPGDRCVIPSCRRALTAAQQAYHTVVCSPRCEHHLKILRATVAVAT